MDLSIYDVIKGPVISEKAYDLHQEQKKLVLNVHMHANKLMIKQALEKFFNVKVKNVRTSIRDGKRRKLRGRITHGIATKKAYITLAEGYSIDLTGQSGVQTSAHAVSPQKSNE